jgi:hypothetical protein
MKAAPPQEGLSRWSIAPAAAAASLAGRVLNSSGDPRRSCQKSKIASKIGSFGRQADAVYSYLTTGRA